jgi:hypothetical protein
MNRLKFRTLCVVGVAFLAGCGDQSNRIQPSQADAGRNRIHSFTFMAFGDSKNGQLTIVPDFDGVPAPGEVAPNRELVDISESYPVADSKVSVYTNGSPIITYSTPAGCGAAPAYMTASVTAESGYSAYQLRNVYAQLTEVSAGGIRFCNSDPPGPFGLSNALGLYLYAPLDFGPNGATSAARNWAIQLPDQGPFWFKGIIQAEVLPGEPWGFYPADQTSTTLATFESLGRLNWANQLSDDPDSAAAFPRQMPTAGLHLEVSSCTVNSKGVWACSAPFYLADLFATSSPLALSVGKYRARYDLIYKLPSSSSVLRPQRFFYTNSFTILP